MENLNNKIAFFIDQNLRKVGNKNFAESQKKLIGKKIVSYGVRISEVRKIARNCFRQFQEKEIDWLEIIKELIMTKVLENQMVGIFLLGHLIRTGRKITISEIEKLIK
ncbi:MAG: DNA alkylation repair protein, partial [Candidatus Paceibacterota bacterium]